MSSMGYGCTRLDERLLASRGLLESEPRFSDNKDIPFGGVLFTVPALLENGLLKYLKEYYKLEPGYYTIDQLFLTMAFMPLLRLKSLENLRNVSPGEFGKLIGLDRVPEVKTLRSKLSELSSQGRVKSWSAELSEHWMQSTPDSFGVFYVDGHVRVYHGKQTNLPAKYVTRQKLCLRGEIDYWVNDFLGRPFFVVRKSVNSGLIKVLREEIIPELIKAVPCQPSQEEFTSDRTLSRFMIVFDREGYSPAFFKELWEHRIAVCTYRKYHSDRWSDDEFMQVKVIMKNGEVTDMKLAERGTFLGGKIWVREIRKLTESGHQTSIISTDFHTETGKLAVAMFSRWYQENFFKYMMEHYGIDKLIEYETKDIKDTETVVNPDYRALEYRVKKAASYLQRVRAKFSTYHVPDSLSGAKKLKEENKKAELVEDIEIMESELTKLKQQRKDTPKHIQYSQLPESHKFKGLAADKKLLIDTIKMISYRAETCLVRIARDYMSHKDESRNLIRELFKTDIDLVVDKEKKVINVLLHNQSSKSLDKVVKNICEELNKSETKFPGTNLRLCYDLVSFNNP